MATRISNISEYIDGADNVINIDVIQGEQRILTGTLRDASNNALDISAFTLEVATEFFFADVQETTRSTTINALVSQTPTSSAPATIAASDAANGEFQLTIPHNLYGDAISSNITTGVPMAVLYVRYSDGTPGAPGTTSRISRFTVIIRRAIAFN